LTPVIWNKDGKTTRQYYKSAIYLFVDGQTAISPSLGGRKYVEGACPRRRHHANMLSDATFEKRYRIGEHGLRDFSTVFPGNLESENLALRE